jgi:hypothetical protein
MDDSAEIHGADPLFNGIRGGEQVLLCEWKKVRGNAEKIIPNCPGMRAIDIAKFLP